MNNFHIENNKTHSPKSVGTYYHLSIFEIENDIFGFLNRSCSVSGTSSSDSLIKFYWVRIQLTFTFEERISLKINKETYLALDFYRSNHMLVIFMIVGDKNITIQVNI